MTIERFSLGDVVCLNSHPYSKQSKNVTIIGEHQLTPPLMLITEIQHDTKDSYDEQTSIEISRVGLSNCKCIWFSHKTFQIEEVWFSSKVLEKVSSSRNYSKEELSYSILLPIDESKPESNPKTTRRFYNVVLKSNELELSKKKSTQTFNNSNVSQTNVEKNTTNSFLAFASPVMEIIQIVEAKDIDSKEPKFNQRTGLKRKETSKWLVKCKWFNPLSDKFSEKLLPIEILVRIENQEELIQYLNSLIAENKASADTFDINKPKPRYIKNGKTILKPSGLLFKSGYYYLRAYDYLQNNYTTTILSSLNIKFDEKIDDYKSETYPKFKYISGGVYNDSTRESEILTGLKKAEKNNYFIRIKYSNFENKKTYRCISNYRIVTVKSEKSAKAKTENYLIGYDYLKNEIRTFKIVKIIKLEVLPIKYELVSKPPTRLEEIGLEKKQLRPKRTPDKKSS